MNETPILTQYDMAWKQYRKAVVTYNSMFHNLNKIYVESNMEPEERYLFLESMADDEVASSSAKRPRGNKKTIECDGIYMVQELGIELY